MNKIHDTPDGWCKARRGASQKPEKYLAKIKGKDDICTWTILTRRIYTRRIQRIEKEERY